MRTFYQQLHWLLSFHGKISSIYSVKLILCYLFYNDDLPKNLLILFPLPSSKLQLACPHIKDDVFDCSMLFGDVTISVDRRKLTSLTC